MGRGICYSLQAFRHWYLSPRMMDEKSSLSGGGGLALLLTQSALMEQISIYLCSPALVIVSSCLHILAIMLCKSLKSWMVCRPNPLHCAICVDVIVKGVTILVRHLSYLLCVCCCGLLLCVSDMCVCVSDHQNCMCVVRFLFCFVCAPNCKCKVSTTAVREYSDLVVITHQKEQCYLFMVLAWCIVSKHHSQKRGCCPTML